MKNSDKIILYLDNRLNEEDKIKFEKELELSPLLNEELQRIKNNLNEIRKSSNVELDESYFNGLVPGFRRRNEHINIPKKRIIPIYLTAIPAAAVLIVVLFLFIFRQQEETPLDINNIEYSELEGIITDYSLYENMNVLSEETDNFITEKIDSVMVEEINLTDSGINYLESEDYSSLIASISDAEAELIYNELINKDIIPGEL